MSLAFDEDQPPSDVDIKSSTQTTAIEDGRSETTLKPATTVPLHYDTPNSVDLISRKLSKGEELSKVPKPSYQRYRTTSRLLAVLGVA